jgi:uncharacterized protein YhaN
MAIVDVPKPMSLPQRLEELADELAQPANLATLGNSISKAVVLLKLAATTIRADQAPLRNSMDAFDRAREALEQVLAGSGVTSYCPYCDGSDDER